MPRALTETERSAIRKKLLDGAEQCMKQFGVRKTTVDELVRRANISKGTFYLLYDSKERLLLEVIMKHHNDVHNQLNRQISGLSKPATVDQVTRLLFDLFQQVEGSVLFGMMNDGDMELLLRKLPPDLAREHAQADSFSVEQLLALVPGVAEEEKAAFGAALRAIFFSMLHRKDIGEQWFSEGLELALRGIVLQLFERSKA